MQSRHAAIIIAPGLILTLRGAMSVSKQQVCDAQSACHSGCMWPSRWQRPAPRRLHSAI